MISYTYKIILKNIVKGSVYFVFAFILLLIPLNIGKKNIDKIHTTILIFSNVQLVDVEYSSKIKNLWETNFDNTVLSIHHDVHLLNEKANLIGHEILKFDDDNVKKIFSDIIIDYGNLDNEKTKQNFYENLDLWVDRDKYKYLRYELNYNENQIEDVNKLIELFYQSFKNLVKNNLNDQTSRKIKTFERNERIFINEKLNVLSNYPQLNNTTNLQINIDFNSDEINPKILQLDAKKIFIDINKKDFDNYFRIRINSKDYDWFKSKQYYLGYILIIIISILVSMFFTINRKDEKL